MARNRQDGAYSRRLDKAIDDSSSMWFYWSMLGTGVGVAITGIVLLGIGGIFGADWERREIDSISAAEGTSQAVSFERAVQPLVGPLVTRA